MVYIREAHPKDGWALGDTSLIEDPKTLDERQAAATVCAATYGFEFTAVVDDMLDSTAIRYAAWPERLFVIDPQGRVAYAGGQGPTDFHARSSAASVGADGRDVSLEAFLEAL